MFDKRGACRLLVAIAASCVLAATAFAQSFPDRPVKLVTYYSAGSGPDLVIRTVAERLGKMWGQSVIVDNRPGGGGMVSINALKAAAPDGYTFGVSDNSVLVVYPLLNPSVPFQADKELTPMALWMNTPFYLVVSPQSPFRTAADLIAYARANPGKLSYGSPTGIGNPGHLGMEIFKAETGTNLVLIPYKTSQPMFADMATGRLDAAFATFGSARAAIQNGGVVPIAVASRRRQAVQPDIPTLAESGGPADLEVNGWMAMFAPRGVPPQILKKVSADVDQALRSPEVIKRITDLGNEAVTGDGDKVAEMLRNDNGRLGKSIKALGIKAE